jgi:hypothetical protein
MEVHPAGEFLGVAPINRALDDALSVPARLVAHATTSQTAVFQVAMRF